MNAQPRNKESVLKATSVLVLVMAAAASMVSTAGAQEIVFGSRAPSAGRAPGGDVLVSALSSTARKSSNGVTTDVAQILPARVAEPSSVAAVVVPEKAASTFSVSRNDRTIRETLAKWARAANWVNEPEHWTVGFDLPVHSSAELGTDFKGAVRALLSSTDLTNMPLQPCFYSNQVLRVVPKAELCDRSAN